MKTTSKNEDDLNNEENLRNEDDFKNGDNLKNEDLENEDDLSPPNKFYIAFPQFSYQPTQPKIKKRNIRLEFPPPKHHKARAYTT